MSETTTDLVVLSNNSIPTILAADDEDILGQLYERLRKLNADPSTKDGRDKIRSAAADVARAKMDLVRLGKGLTEGWRKSTAAVNSEIKTIEARMDELKSQVRQPLTEYEDREKRRVEGHENALAAIDALFADLPEDATEEMVRGALNELDQISARPWEEFAERAATLTKMIRSALLGVVAAAQAKAAAEAEAARLAAEAAEQAARQAEQEQRERDARIAREAAERARLAAEAEAQRQAEEVRRLEALRLAAAARREQEAKDAAARAEREKEEAIAAAAERERLAREAAEREKAEALALAARQQQEALDAQERRMAEADRQLQAAAEAERAAAHARAADKSHRAKINTDAMSALVAAGLPDKEARAAVVAIARGAIPHVTITY